MKFSFYDLMDSAKLKRKHGNEWCDILGHVCRGLNSTSFFTQCHLIPLTTAPPHMALAHFHLRNPRIHCQRPSPHFFTSGKGGWTQPNIFSGTLRSQTSLVGLLNWKVDVTPCRGHSPGFNLTACQMPKFCFCWGGGVWIKCPELPVSFLSHFFLWGFSPAFWASPSTSFSCCLPPHFSLRQQSRLWISCLVRTGAR